MADAAAHEYKEMKARYKSANSANDAGRRRFTLLPFAEITLDHEAPYLVKGLIPRESLVVLWGPPKCGKSFWAFDLSMHVALGWPYRGRSVVKGAVVFIAAEGERGLRARIEAFRIAKLEGKPVMPAFYLLPTRLALASEVAALIDDIRDQLGPDGCAAIVIDTLNRTIVGSESDDRDMGDYIKAADALREAFACAVILIHHCGIDGSRPRGHTSLTGACDAQIAIKRDAANQIIATVEWMKDGAEGIDIASALKVVEVGTDEDGEPITSCIVEVADEAAAKGARPPKLGVAAKIALELLRRALDEAGETPPASNHIPQGRRAVAQDVWRQYCYQGSISASEKQEARQKAFARASQDLQAATIIGVWGGWVWII